MFMVTGLYTVQKGLGLPRSFAGQLVRPLLPGAGWRRRMADAAAPLIAIPARRSPCARRRSTSCGPNDDDQRDDGEQQAARQTKNSTERLAMTKVAIVIAASGKVGPRGNEKPPRMKRITLPPSSSVRDRRVVEDAGKAVELRTRLA